MHKGSISNPTLNWKLVTIILYHHEIIGSSLFHNELWFGSCGFYDQWGPKQLHIIRVKTFIALSFFPHYRNYGNQYNAATVSPQLLSQLMMHTNFPQIGKWVILRNVKDPVLFFVDMLLSSELVSRFQPMGLSTWLLYFWFYYSKTSFQCFQFKSRSA